MNPSQPLRLLVPAAIGLLLASSPSRAAAQASPLPDSFTLGTWTFRPLIEVRVRGEYRRDPFDAGGDVYAPSAVLAEAYQSELPPVAVKQPPVQNQYFVAERSRLGLAIDHGPVTAAVTLQDARLWGDTGSTPLVAPGEPVPPSLAPYEAYLEAHTRSGRRIFLRVGRQKVTWGDGRLVGADDWSTTGRSLDAARFGIQAGDFDVETFAAMLATPGRYNPLAPSMTSSTMSDLAEGSGAQLYGVDAVWHALPLLAVEVTGLARIVRQPAPSTLTPSNTFVADGRIAGDRRGFRYAVEGAYELGQVASYGIDRDLRAFAFAARASWETALPWHLTFDAEGAYASGDQGHSTGAETRFDPILPDQHTLLSPMSVVSWSNIILGGASLGVRPSEEVGLLAGYRYAALAEPGDRWSNAALYPIGAAPKNTARALGHEVDAAVRITPWRAFEIETGYGLFVREAGAEAILGVAGRQTALQHWAYLQTTVRMP